jgi:dihydrofolate reductase
MKRIRYSVATSLDGFIAGPNGEYDWIEPDPEVDFAKFWAEFDTLLMGRHTYELAIGARGKSAFQGMKTFVVSRTLRAADHPQVTVLPEITKAVLQSMRKQPGEKDIYLFGGGQLFRSVLELREVDTIELAIKPVLLGAGIPLLAPPSPRIKLKLVENKIYRSGTVRAVYSLAG